MTYERPMSRNEALSVLCGFLALFVFSALLLLGMGCATTKPQSDVYPQGWESRCIKAKADARAWYVSQHGQPAKEPIVKVELKQGGWYIPNNPVMVYGTSEPRGGWWMVKVESTLPGFEWRLDHEFRHCWLMLNKGDNSERGVK